MVRNPPPAPASSLSRGVLVGLLRLQAAYAYGWSLTSREPTLPLAPFRENAAALREMVCRMPRCALRLDGHAALSLDVLQQLPREFLPLKEPRSLERGRRARKRIGVG